MGQWYVKTVLCILKIPTKSEYFIIPISFTFMSFTQVSLGILMDIFGFIGTYTSVVFLPFNVKLMERNETNSDCGTFFKTASLTLYKCIIKRKQESCSRLESLRRCGN